MLADECFNKILYQVQHSSLNYQMKVTPFSAIVSLKKTFAKDKSGKCMLPQAFNNYPFIDVHDIHKNFTKLQKDFPASLRKQEELLEELADAYETIKTLKKTNKECVIIIENLENDLSNARDDAVFINDAHNNLRIKYENDKMEFFRQQSSNVTSGAIATKQLDLERKSSGLGFRAGNEEGSTYVDDQSVMTLCNDAMVVDSSEIQCSNCTDTTQKYVSTYFSGNKVSSICSDCFNDDDAQLDCFKSFPDEDMPNSLVSHWIPSCFINRNSTCGLSSISSLRSHYSRLPSPGERFTAMEDMMVEFRVLLNAQKQGYKDSCRQS